MTEMESNPDALIEELEQELFALNREQELADLRLSSLDEELELEAEIALGEAQETQEEIDKLKKEIIVESNRIVTDSGFNPFQDLSASYLDVSSCNVSTVMEASICEPEEITILTNELKENEIKLRESKSKLEEDEFQLKEIRNRNLLTENEIGNLRHQHNTLKQEFKEKEEEFIMINAEMSLLPNMKRQQVQEDSIYDELVRNMEVIKTELTDKKKRLTHYVTVLQEIESECKRVEGEILVLDVYDREDDTRRLQSQATILEAYKQYQKELEKSIQTLQTITSDLPSLLNADPSNPELTTKTICQYHDYVNVRLKKLNHELTYHKMELQSVGDKEIQLVSNVNLLKEEIKKHQREVEKLAKQIEDVKNGVEKCAQEKENHKTKVEEEINLKDVKMKSVRFQTNTPVKTKSENKENDGSCMNEEDGERQKRPMEKQAQEPGKIVIHKRRQNKKPINIIKEY